MPAIVLPQRWREQPRHAVDVDWSHPLASRLAFAFIASNGVRNLVDGDIAPTMYGAHEYADAVTPEGVAQRFTGLGSPYFAQGLAIADGYTMFAGVRPSIVKAQAILVATLNPGNSSDTSFMGLGLGINSGVAVASMTYRPTGGSVAGATSAAATGIAVGERGLVWGEVVAAGNYREARMNNGAAGTNSGSYAFGNGRAYTLGGVANNNNTRRFEGDIEFALGFHQLFDEGARAALHEAPYQIFRRNPRRVYFDVGNTAAPAEIGAAVAGEGAAAGDITTAIRVAAVALGVSDAAAGISTVITVEADVLGIGDAHGVLATEIRIAADALGAGLQAASIATGISVAAMVGGEGAMSVALSIGASIGAGVLGEALVSAGIATALRISAVTAGEGAMSASLGGTAAEIGAGVDGAGAMSGSVHTRVQVSAAVLGEALMTGALVLRTPIGAVVDGVATVVAGIETAIRIGGAVAGEGLAVAQIEVETMPAWGRNPRFVAASAPRPFRASPERRFGVASRRAFRVKA